MFPFFTFAIADPVKISKSMQMKSNATLKLFIFSCLFFSPAIAQAACTDPPEEGVDWRRCLFNGDSLNGVDLKNARLRDASFFRAEIKESDLSGADAFRAKFVNAIMTGVRFDSAKVTEADFTKADLSNASFVGSDMRRAKFNRANLRGADLTDARLQGADLTRADLSGATWTSGSKVCAEGSIGRCN